MATASAGENIQFSNTQILTLQLEQTLSGHEDRVWCVAWSPKGNILASCGADKTVRIWTREDGKMVKLLIIFSFIINRMQYNTVLVCRYSEMI